MDDTDIDQLFGLKGEHFYQHIIEQYGKFVEKILRYHDIDSFFVLNQVSHQELIDLFEKPNDENSSDELINLKKEICNIFHDSISLKVGTKNKVMLLLKATQYIFKRRKSQLSSQARLNRIDKQRSSFSSSTERSTSDSEVDLQKYYSSIEESLGKLLTEVKKNIHGIIHTDVSVKDFKIILEKKDDSIVPICSIKCICGDRLKLYLKYHRFQLSNFAKHLKTINNKSSSFTSNQSKELDETGILGGTDSDIQLLKTERNRSLTENDSSEYMNVDTNSNETYTPQALKNNQSQQSRIVTDNSQRNGSSTTTTENKYDAQSSTPVASKEGEIQTSISFISSRPKKQPINNQQQQQTTTSASTYQHLLSFKQQSLNSNDLSQSKKRKLNGKDKRNELGLPTNSTKKIAKRNVSYFNASSSDILCTLLNTIELNRHRSPNNYRYSNPVLRFATCLFILAGTYVYEFVRINLKFLLPSIETIKSYYKDNPYSEAEFRFDEAKTYLDSIQCQFVFISEDCSAIIPRVEYDSTLNNFNGFATPIVSGKPIENAINCQSFEELKYSIDTQPLARFVNVHLLQPISPSTFFATPSATVLSAYGTDHRITSLDILRRWLMIYQELYSRNIRVLGFATDGDPKYLRAMRLASNFFVKTQTLHIDNDKLSFVISIPSNWSSWYYLKSNQIFLFMQDGIHVCTKIRNRFLSKNTKLKMGKYKVLVQHLYQLIDTTNKIDHNLSNSDLNVRDKQNFSSCQRISDDKILNLLLLKDHYKGTFNYLLVLNLLITAFTRSDVCLLTRIYYAWIALFFLRLWRIWLYKTKPTRKSSTKDKEKNEKKFFITSNALLSIELNSHCLIYLYLLIQQKSIPETTANSIHLFSSQPCENIFRDARALSGIYTTRINFTMKQFLQRINKLNALTELRQFESTNTKEKIHFPVHHKIKRLYHEREPNDIAEHINFNSDNVEEIIHEAYKSAQQMVVSVGMDKVLIKYNLFNFEESSIMTHNLLQLNSLTESHMLVLDAYNDEDNDEENSFEECDDEDNCTDGDDELGDTTASDGDDEQGDTTAGDVEDDWTENDNEEEDNFEQNSILMNHLEDEGAEDGDIEDYVDDNDIEELNEEVNDDCSTEDDSGATTSFDNLYTTSFSGLRLVQSVSKANAHKYFSINVHHRKMFLHKATATWYLQDRQSRLSCDRLRRVQLKTL